MKSQIVAQRFGNNLVIAAMVRERVLGKRAWQISKRIEHSGLNISRI
jgi:hypothetical protein